MSSSKTCMMNAHMPWDELKRKCKCTSVLDSSVFKDEVFMKFNYPQQNETNMKKAGTFNAIFWKDGLIFFPFLSGFHSYTMSSPLSILHALQRWAHISPWEIDNMNPITSDKASSRKSSHPKKLIIDTSKNITLHPFSTLKLHQFPQSHCSNTSSLSFRSRVKRQWQVKKPRFDHRWIIQH